MKPVAFAVAVLLTVWDLYWLAFLTGMPRVVPPAAVEFQRTRAVLGIAVSVLAVLLFIKT